MMKDFGLQLEAYFQKLKDDQFHWLCELRKGGKTVYTGQYSAGLAHCTKAPKHGMAVYKVPMNAKIARTFKPFGSLSVADTEGFVIPTAPTLKQYLYCLQSDANVGEYLLFEDFASEFGYDEDSRKAEAVWRACQKIRGGLMKILGSDFEEFITYNFDE